MAAVAALQPGETLEIIVPFQPFPLYAVMEAKGFEHSSQSNPDGSWRVVFTRK